MVAVKRTGGSLLGRSKKRVKTEMTAPERTYEVRPSGEIDYVALCEDVSQRFPHILKRLAE